MAFTVRDFRDLVQVLEGHPEWRAELRRLVLTEELLTLPAVVRELAEAQRRTEERIGSLAEAQRRTEERIGSLAEAQRRTEERIGSLAEAQRRTEERIGSLAEAQRRTEERIGSLAEAQRRTEERIGSLAEAQQRLAEEFAAFRMETERRFQALAEALEALTRRTEQLAEQVGSMRGDVLEIRYREHAPAYFDDLLRRIRVVSSQELATLLDEPLAKGVISKAERKDLLMSDIVVRGRRWEDDAEAYLVVEVSAGIGKGEVERVVRRAEILTRALERPSMTAVAGEWLTPEADRLARGWGVWRVLDGQVLAPTEE